MKRLTALLLVAVLAVGLYAPPARAAFPDISDPQVAAAAAMLQSLGLVSGYGDGNYHPDDPLTRAQFCKIAVLLSGTENASAYEGYTIFPDVRSGHWARGYVNAAVRALKIIAGFPDGTFRPDTPITFAQAVTMLMRLLGATDEAVGADWPRGYLNAAAVAGLTKGLTYPDNAVITRASGALLFYNALFTKNKAGATIAEALGLAALEVLVLQSAGLAPDGVTRGLVTLTGGELAFYPTSAPVPAEAGARGTLTVDGAGRALSFVPQTQTRRDIVVAEAGPLSVTGMDGARVDNIPAKTQLIAPDGRTALWEASWLDMTVSQSLRFVFTASGGIDYIFWNPASGAGETVVLTFEPAAGQNPLPLLGMAAAAKVYKNGVAATWADLRRWDVLVCNRTAGVVTATDFRIIGIYEDAKPNREAPAQVITLGGQTFPVLDGARVKLAARKIGEAMTFLFTPDGQVADIQDATALPAMQPGILTAEDTVTLYNGLTITGANQWADTLREGSLVLAAQRNPGRLSLQRLPTRGAAALDLGTGQIGSAAVAPYALFYDVSGPEGRAVTVRRTTLPDSLPAARVLTVRADAGGRADIIVLNNATGDALYYGVTRFVRNRIDESDGATIPLDDLATLTDQNGDHAFLDVDEITGGLFGGEVYGLAGTVSGDLASIQPCVKVTGLKRADFLGNTALTVSGRALPLPDGLKVLVEATGAYVTVAEARVYANSFTAYLDKPAAEGGKPRIIIAH
ncbi:MAG: S-layer homology domain-containing protein [Oscillospiraceae bacterium]|jgi:hypothetical protein|nr:S-layer homology domain-containing protein [Oscillospiraceae bacterium]